MTTSPASRVDSENALVRCRRNLGPDHPDTLAAATVVAMERARVGEDKRARTLAEDTFVRQRRVLGDDHPDRLVSAVTLAIVLRRLGDDTRARRLRRDSSNPNSTVGIIAKQNVPIE